MFPPPRDQGRVPGLDSHLNCTWRKEDILLTLRPGGEGGGVFRPPRGQGRVPGLDSQVYYTWRKEDFLLTLRQEGREGVRFLHHVARGGSLG